MKIGLSALVMVVFLGTLLAAPARAVVVTVENPGFEDIIGETQVNEFTFGPLNGWDLYDPDGITGGGAGNTYFIGTLMPSPPTNFFAGQFEGQRVGIAFNFSGSGDEGEYGMQQTLTETLQPNTTYSLDVAIGNIASGFAQSGSFFDLDGFPGYRVDLLAGGVLLAQDNNSLNSLIPEGEFADTNVSFTSGADSLPFGANLEIRLVNLNVVDPLFLDADLEVDFDNVRLTAVSIPEPSSLAMVAIFTTAMLGGRRRHRQSAR